MHTIEICAAEQNLNKISPLHKFIFMYYKYMTHLNTLINTLNKKKFFLLKIFSNLIFQLIITFIIAFNVKTTLFNKNLYFISLIIFQFILIISLAWIRMHQFIKFILMTLFSICWGLLFIRIKQYVSPEIIKASLLSVLSIFIIMFCIGLLLIAFNINLGHKVGLFLLFALMFVIISYIVILFMNKYNIFHKIIAIVIITLMSLFIIYDTNIILQRNYEGDFITASIDYYLDILNIFISLINYH